MTQLPRETYKDGDTQTNQRNINEYAKYKPRLNTEKIHTRPNRAVWTGPGSCAHGKLPMYSLNARDNFRVTSLTLMTSDKQSNGRRIDVISAGEPRKQLVHFTRHVLRT